MRSAALMITRTFTPRSAAFASSLTRSSNTKWCISTSIDLRPRAISSLIIAIGALLGENLTSSVAHAPASAGLAFQIASKWHWKPPSSGSP
jgi:hypothetical protein